MAKKIIIIILSVLLIISVIGNVFLYIENGNTALLLRKNTEELSADQVTLSEKETELSEVNTKITELGNSVTDLQNQITDLEKQLNELKDKLAQAEREKTEREEAEKKEAEVQAAKAKAGNKSSVQKTYEEWDISGYVWEDEEVLSNGLSELEDLGEYDNSPGSGDFAGITIY